MISPAGKIVKLHGPSEAPPLGEETASTADVSAALNALVTQKLARNDKAGLVRGTGAEAIPPDPWLVNVTQSGNRCLPMGRSITVWRPDGGDEAEFIIAPSDRSWQARASWQAGQERLELPRDLPLPSRSTYLAKLAGKEVSITLMILPDSLTTVAVRAAWMAEVGCDAQALALLQTVNKGGDTVTPAPRTPVTGSPLPPKAAAP